MRTGDYPDDWDERAQRVRARDNHQCQQCGATDTTLQVHHITPISEGGSHALDNLETVCRSCHAAEHPTKVRLNRALNKHRRIRMKYRSGSGTRVRELDPYALEMHEGIQYLVGHDYYRDEIRHFRPTRIKWVELTDDQFNPPSDFDAESYLDSALHSRQGSSECFLATAAYGSRQADDLDRLRAVRDDILLETPGGGAVVEAYYRASPPVAAWVARSERRRRLVRRLIIRPILAVIALLRAPSD